MGKFLRVLVVFFLLLSAGALTLGILLFNKRELLKGRTQKLENTLITLGTMVEEEQAKVDPLPVYTAQDIDRVEAQMLDAPQRSIFWDSFRHELEVQDLPTLDLNRKRLELMTYYQMDPLTMKPKRDEVTGYKITTGPGTMQEVLDDIIAKQELQYTRLDETRTELQKTRKELIRVIEELNTTKNTLRQKLVKIVELNAEIVRLNGVIRQKEDQIAQLEEEKRGLEDQITQLNQVIEDKNLEIDKHLATIDQKQAEIEELRRAGNVSATMQADTRDAGGRPPRPLTPEIATRGIKGKVISVDTDYAFLIMELDPEFVAGIAPDENFGIPMIDLLIKRTRPNGKSHEYITKVRLLQLRLDENIAIGDVLMNWQQSPAQAGDIVFF